MSWIYHQSSGKMYRHDLVTSNGYAGKGSCKNHPEFQPIEGKGALPRGKYSIGAPFHPPVTGDYSLRLTASPGNNMFGRSHFLIHGPNHKHRDDSSDGRIVISPAVRAKIWTSGDRQLEVAQ